MDFYVSILPCLLIVLMVNCQLTNYTIGAEVTPIFNACLCVLHVHAFHVS